MYNLISFFLHFQIFDLFLELQNLLHHLLFLFLTVLIFTGYRFPMWTLVIVCFILIIVDYFVALWNKLAPKWQLVERIHNHSIDFSVFFPSASLRAVEVLFQTSFAIEARASLTFCWIQHNTSAHYAYKFTFKFNATRSRSSRLSACIKLRIQITQRWEN